MKLMRFRDSQEVDLPLTSLIDITFLLLVFFLCTLRFKTLEGKLETFLPKEGGTTQAPSEPREDIEIVVRVLEEGPRVVPGTAEPWTGFGRFDFLERKVSYGIAGRELATKRDLIDRLSSLHRADPTRRVTIVGLPGTRVQEVVAAIDAAIGAGFEEIALAASDRP